MLFHIFCQFLSFFFFYFSFQPVSPFTILIRTVDIQESLTAGLMPTCAASAGASPRCPPRGPTGAPKEGQLCSDRVTGWWPLEGGVLLNDHPRAPALVPPLEPSLVGPWLGQVCHLHSLVYIFFYFLPFYFFLNLERPVG